MELTILMPCLDEEKTIGLCIDEARSFLDRRRIDGEILIVDNGSTDASAAIAREHGARIITVPEKGYGNALRAGISAANGQYIIMGDCDYSYDFEKLDSFLKLLREDNDLVVGNRMNADMEPGAMPFWHRYVGVPFLSWLGRRIYKVNVRDFHCGLRAFKRESAVKLTFSGGGMEFASEMIGMYAAAGCKIAQTDIRYRCDKRQGRSHLRSIPDAFRHIRRMVSDRMS